MILKQLTDQNIPVQLSSPSVLFSNLLVEILKPGESSWSLLTVATQDWVTVGSGYYSLKLKGVDLNILGPTLLRISSLTMAFTTVVVNLDVLARSTDEVQPLNQCLLFGTLVGVDGKPAPDQEVIIRIMDLPFSSSNVLATTQPAKTRSNATGEFEFNLLRLSTVMIEIASSGIRHQFVVPDQPTLSLVDALNL